MINKILSALFLLFSVVLANRIDLGEIKYDMIDEASGIASSKNNSNIIWIHNDSGDRSRIYAVGIDGSHLGVVNITGVIARDWEDMCIGPGPEKNIDYIYIGDIGDNFSTKEKKRIHRFKEPIINLDSMQVPFSISIKEVETITFSYPDKKFDSETLMIDSSTKDLYLVTKRQNPAQIYRLPFPQSTEQTIDAEYVGNLSIPKKGEYPALDWVSSGEISRDGKQVLIKTYDNIYLIKKKNNLDLFSTLNSTQKELKYIPEPQGEAVCFRWDQLGYYTVSEEYDKIPAHIYYYKFLD